MPYILESRRQDLIARGVTTGVEPSLNYIPESRGEMGGMVVMLVR